MAAARQLAIWLGLAIIAIPVAAQKNPNGAQTPTTTAPPPQTRSPPKEPGIKVDPVQAAKTIIDIFGKVKKPKSQPAPTAAPAPTQAPAPAVIVPEPAPQPPAPVAVKPVVQPPPPQYGQPKPAQKGPTAPTPSPRPVSATPAAIAPVEAVPIPPAIGAPATAAATSMAPAKPEPPASAFNWLWFALFAALVAAGAVIRWLLFPRPRLRVDFETGGSMVKGSTIQSVGSGFDIRFEIGATRPPTLAVIR